MAKRERPPSYSSEKHQEYTPTIVSVDLREGWDVESWSKEFVTWAHQQPWYRPNLLYSGFDARDVGKSVASTWDFVWASSEEDLLGDERANNPVNYAHEYDEPAIAVYDPAKMREKSVRAYLPADASARIAVVKLTLE